MLTLMLKGILCLMASFILAATTGVDKLCFSLRRIKVPKIIVTLLLLMYRYVTLMMDEVSVMYTAYSLRAPGQKGIHFSAWGSFLGQLLLRSSDKAEELYVSMRLRGFDGDFDHVVDTRPGLKDICFGLMAIVIIITFRIFNVAVLLGNLFI